MRGEILIFWLVGLAAAGIWAGRHWFSPAARVERRRRKSHSRIISKTNRRTVRFSVKPPKK
jgi:hypothetical protein